jgi:hypothetical protein
MRTQSSPGNFVYKTRDNQKRSINRTASSANIIQPPMMSGKPGGYNKYSNVSNLFKNDEAGKLIHYFAPHMQNNCHYPNFNARPRSYYVTSSRRRHRSSKKKIVIREDISQEESQLRSELRRMREIIGQKDDGFDDKIKMLMS